MTDAREPILQVCEALYWKWCAQGAPYPVRSFKDMFAGLARMGCRTSAQQRRAKERSRPTFFLLDRGISDLDGRRSQGSGETELTAWSLPWE